MNLAQALAATCLFVQTQLRSTLTAMRASTIVAIALATFAVASSVPRAADVLYIWIDIDVFGIIWICTGCMDLYGSTWIDMNVHESIWI